MKDDYRKIFKELVRAYHQDKLNNKVEELIYKENLDKNKLAYIISSLCGVEVDLNENFSKNLEEAIKNYTPNHKLLANLILVLEIVQMNLVKLFVKNLVQLTL